MNGEILGTDQQMLEAIITLFVDLFIPGLSFGHGNAKVHVGDPTPLEDDASLFSSTFLLLCVHLTSTPPPGLWVFAVAPQEQACFMSAQGPVSRFGSASFHSPPLWVAMVPGKLYQLYWHLAPIPSYRKLN